ncbi:hypothetical protein DE146DRAFT_733042 [Phaeosphaeria sp. MPI-PUGE-AT-0046c]|nr:hypothetical protein DE146DRAFT_733042 [Phaeosphaeria sp. MPI-PUGE-AT-0046c]
MARASLNTRKWKRDSDTDCLENDNNGDSIAVPPRSQAAPRETRVQPLLRQTLSQANVTPYGQAANISELHTASTTLPAATTSLEPPSTSDDDVTTHCCYHCLTRGGLAAFKCRYENGQSSCTLCVKEKKKICRLPTEDEAQRIAARCDRCKIRGFKTCNGVRPACDTCIRNKTPHVCWKPRKTPATGAVAQAAPVSVTMSTRAAPPTAPKSGRKRRKVVQEQFFEGFTDDHDAGKIGPIIENSLMMYDHSDTGNSRRPQQVRSTRTNLSHEKVSSVEKSLHIDAEYQSMDEMLATDERLLYDESRVDVAKSKVAESFHGGRDAEQEVVENKDSGNDSSTERCLRRSASNTSMLDKAVPMDATSASDEDEEARIQLELQRQNSVLVPNVESRPRRNRARLSYVGPALDLFSDQSSDAGQDDHDDESDVYMSTVFEHAGGSDEELQLDEIIEERSSVDSGAPTDDEETDVAADTRSDKAVSKPRKKQNASLSQGKGIDFRLPPIDDIQSAFDDMTNNALQSGLERALQRLDGQQLNVATMCSGTESPLLALEMISKALRRAGHAPLAVHQKFAAEIDVFKQAFIERNQAPDVIFRDVRDFIPEDATTAITAYGAEVPIPSQVHILVAGFVCKDLSRLNSKQKELQDDGESGDTWRSIYSYAKRFRPAVVLLENVKNKAALWDKVVSMWDEIDYEAAWLFRDTKRYYIPQTRERIYMIAIERSQFGKGVDKAVAQWRESMEKLQRQCSSPYEAWLATTLHDTSDHSALVSEVNWDLCKLRYDHIRSDERLGVLRPVTKWSENGTVRPPSFANRAWYNSQSSRVYDAIDVAHLQAAQKGYDSLYKMAVLDVSQNVDRFKTALGLLPCITPGGCDFATNRQEALSGKQLLLLQGMPMHKLLFGSETQKTCQDLAGNAMTTTVIGASLLSAIICWSQAFQSGTSNGLSHQAAVYHGGLSSAQFIRAESVKEARLPSVATAQINLAELIVDAKVSAKLCTCEGEKSIAKSSIQICSDCGGTACERCAGNPRHRYRASISRTERCHTPNDFEQKWRALLPSRLKFRSIPEIRQLIGGRKSLDKAVDAYLAHVIDSRIGMQSFCLRDMLRQDYGWLVTYSSTHSRLELRISQTLDWLLFIECQSGLPGNASSRNLFQLPVARAQVTQSLIDLNWEFRIPIMANQKLRISSSGPRISSWRSRLGLLDHRDETVPTVLQVRSHARECNVVIGDYKLMPDCGTASSSLYKRIGGPTLYLFLDPNPLSGPESDGFVFSEDCSRKHYGDSRISAASIEPTWRPWHVQDEVVCDAACTVSESWNMTDFELEVFAAALSVKIPSNLTSMYRLGQDCSRAIIVLEAKLPERLPIGQIEDYSWVLEAAKHLAAFPEWQSTSIGSRLACECAPVYPRILWSLDRRGVATPHESRKAAASFERAIKTRQPVFHLDTTVDHGKTEILVAMNVAALIHRAFGRLVLPDSTDISTSWRLVTDHAELPLESFSKFRLLSNANDTALSFSPSLSYLRNAQPRSLTWMRVQELGQQITITEVEEAVHVGLGWRAEGRAQAECLIRGGMLADLPSFGKTVTCIALIQSEFDDYSPKALLSKNRQITAEEPALIDCAATLIVCPPHIAIQWQMELKKFLDGQFKTYNILVVQTLSQLQDLTIEDIQGSRVVVLSWNVFTEDGYVSDLAHFTAMPEPNVSGTRSFDTWFDQAAQHIPHQLVVLQRTNYSHFKTDTHALLEERLEHDDFKAALPLKIQHGSAYVSFKATQAKRKTQAKSTVLHGKDKTPQLSQRTHQTPLLHLFRFNRVVVDEYHYLNDNKKLSNVLASVCAKRVPAVKRWVLSGTPALANFSDVDQIASYLGIRLGRYHYGDSVGTTQTDKVRRSDQTAVEEFLSQTEMMSRQWHQARHERAQGFLDLFVRQNEPSLGHIPCLERIYPVQLDIGHHAVYLELSQHLISQKMQIKKLQNKLRSDKVDRLNASLSNSATAEDALLKSALLFKTVSGKSALDYLTELRSEQLRGIQSELSELLAGFEGLPKDEEISDMYNRFKDDILELNWLGDSQASQIVRRLLREATKNPDSSAFPELRGISQVVKAKLMKKRLSSLRETARDLAHLIRSERFISSIKSFSEPLSGESPQRLFQCSNSECDGKASIFELRLITHCGHTACEKCLSRRADSDNCVRSMCNACIQSVNLVKITNLGSTTEPQREQWFGRKLQAVVQIISSFPKGDQGVVFVPNDETVEIIEEVLESHSISFHSLRGCKASAWAKIIEDFKVDDDPKDQSKVLILNIGSESAAGANLVNANHVMFIAPLLTKTQYEYDSAMAQAVARCRRYGQKKTVHIYHIIAQHTIDVDILEHRHKLTDGITTAKSAIKMPKATMSKEKTRLVKNKVGAMALVPASWLADAAKRKMLDLEETPESFASLINFSDTFQNDED